jgi:hypothetical protein
MPHERIEMSSERPLRERITRIETMTEGQVLPALVRIEARQAETVTEGQCLARCPKPLAPWDYVKRATALLVLLGLLSSGAAGMLHLTGMELRRIAEPVAHASPRAAVAPMDAGR